MFGLKFTFLTVAIWFCLIDGTNTYLLSDPLLFNEITSAASSSIQEVQKILLPQNLEISIAVTVSQTIAGGIAGLVSRGTSKAIGNKKKDPLLTKISTTGAFFGARALVRSLFFLLGIPKPIAIVLGTVIGSLLSEEIKYLSRLKRRALVLIGDNDQVLSLPELVGDLTKWIAFDTLDTYFDKDFALPEEELLSFGLGALCSVVGVSVTKILDSKKSQPFLPSINGTVVLTESGVNITDVVTNTTSPVSRVEDSNLFAFAALEGSILFTTFTLAYKVLDKYSPQGLKTKFLFEQMVEDIETFDLPFIDLQ